MELFPLVNVLFTPSSTDIRYGAEAKGDRIPPKANEKCNALKKESPSEPHITTRPALPPTEQKKNVILRDVSKKTNSRLNLMKLWHYELQRSSYINLALKTLFIKNLL